MGNQWVYRVGTRGNIYVTCGSPQFERKKILTFSRKSLNHVESVHISSTNWGVPIFEQTVPSGKRLHSYWKSLSFRGKSNIDRPFSIAMLNYQTVSVCSIPARSKSCQPLALAWCCSLSLAGHDARFVMTCSASHAVAVAIRCGCEKSKSPPLIHWGWSIRMEKWERLDRRLGKMFGFFSANFLLRLKKK